MGARTKKTTMAKLTREARLRERRAVKEERKAARKLDAAQDQDLTGQAMPLRFDVPARSEA
jgi:hypothetical protein